jgi:hypothetical protein
MSGTPESIQSLIERSSLGSEDAREARSRVPLATGQALARAAASGLFRSRSVKTGEMTPGDTAPRSSRPR